MHIAGRQDAKLWRLGMPVMCGLALLAVTGCSMPNMFGSDNSPLPLPPPLEADADGNVADKTGRKDGAEAGDADAASAQPPADGEYPALADVPEGPEATKAAEKSPEAQTARDQLAGDLIADRDQAKYTDEELRGGRVAPVAPPRPQPPAPPRAETPPPAAPQPSVEASPAVASPPPPVLQKPSPMVAAPAPAPVPLTTPAAPRSLPPRPQAAPVQTAPAYSSSTTFQPSAAAPLPADLVAALPAGVAQRYQETLRRPASPIVGGRGVRTGGAYASIPFASGSSQLSSNDRRTIAQVVSAARSGFGRIRVVGHASSTASSASESQRLIANWEVSQARATAVADELASQGIDVGRIVIEAVGDSQAGYAAGNMDPEAAARRVDLFLE